MTNSYYNHASGKPQNVSRGLSSDMRSEFDQIAQAFDKVPDLPIIDGSGQNYYVDTGTVNNIAIALTTNISSAYDGMELVIKAKNAPTGISTITAGSLPVVNILRFDGSPIQANDWVTNQIITLRYDAARGAYQYTPPFNGTATVSIPLSDGSPLLKNAIDTSKLLQFNLAAISTGTTRVYSVTDRNFTISPYIVPSARTSNTILGAADMGSIIDFTSGGFIQTFTAAASLPAGWFVYVKNSGTVTQEVQLEAPSAVSTTSTTSNSISAGTTWTVATGLSISTGDAVLIRRTSDTVNQWISGTVSSYNSGTGSLVVTVIARVGSGTFTDWTITTRPTNTGIDGLANFVVYQNEIRLIYKDNNQFKSIVVEPYYMSRIVTFTYIHPPSYGGTDLDLVGGGGGGGSGCRGATGSVRAGGSPGGTPARIARRINGLITGGSYQCNVGAAGVAGTAITIDNTNGNNGTSGGDTSFGTIITALRGVAGVGGSATTSAVSGSGSVTVGSSGVTGQNGGHPFIPNILGDGSSALSNNIDGGGAGTGVSTSSAGNSVWGGAASPIVDASAANSFNSGSSVYGVPGAGHGGMVTAANTVPAIAGSAGARGSYTVGGGAVGGTCGASPTAGGNGINAAGDYEVGSSGAGGGSSNTVAAQKGGDGGFPGGAGGGGGGSSNGRNSGAGGSGAGGRMVLAGVM